MNGETDEVLVFLEDREGTPIALEVVSSEHIFLLKVFSSFAKPLISLVKQQARYRKLTLCSSSQSYFLPLEVTLSLSKEKSYLHVDYPQVKLVLSFWDMVRGRLAHSLDLLQSMLRVEGMTPSSLSHLPCAASSHVDLGLSPGLLYPAWDRKQDVAVQLRNITGVSVCGKELKDLIKVGISYRNYPTFPWTASNQVATVTVGEKKSVAKLSWQVQPESEQAQYRVSIYICGHPLRDSPLLFLSVHDRQGLITSGHVEAYVGQSISVVVGHPCGKCFLREKKGREKTSSDEEFHYLEAMRVVKSCQWQVPHSDKGVALFVGTDKGLGKTLCLTYDIRARVSPMNHDLLMISLRFNRTLPFHVSAFCTQCLCLLKMYWRETPSCLPRLCRFRPGRVISAQFSTITPKSPVRVAEFSRRRRRGQCPKTMPHISVIIFVSLVD